MKALLLRLLFLTLVVTCAFAALDPTRRDVNMMKSLKKMIAFGSHNAAEATSANGGTECAVCTILVSLAEQFALVNKSGIEKAMEDACNLLPSGAIRLLCHEAVKIFAPAIIPLIEDNATPDEVCWALGTCTNTTCQLFPQSDPNKGLSIPPSEKARLRRPETYESIGPIIEAFENWGNWHMPLIDLDNDNFTDATGTFRGYYWRGKDCNSFNKNIYPGRKTSNMRNEVDFNCNGIYGSDQNGNSLESTLCGNTTQYGVAILGDSAAAHFHIPPEYFEPAKWDSSTFESILDILFNEMDWPQMSMTTGFEQTDWNGRPKGGVASMYLYGVQNNRCAFSDYQNIGVNGARTGSMKSNVMFGLARDQQNDYPLLLTYALIGNDVCNGHPGTGHMTTPEEFYENVMDAFTYLDTVLPKGSHITIFGLAQGIVLYETMHNRIHPLGQLRQDLTYENVYDFLNCLQISPCWGWLNSDPYWRRQTQKRAHELNEVYQKIISTTTWKNFDLTYFDYPIVPVIEEYVKKGGAAWQLIEPVDGFHPDQMANFLLAQYQWNLYNANYTYLVPPVNPNNAEIDKLFGPFPF